MKVPIDHPNWLYELKHDGFRGMLYVDRDRAWFRSRKGNEMGRFGSLAQHIHALLKDQRAILDGEIVVLDEQGRSIFADLMMGKGEPGYCVFDLVWLNGRDLRHKPLVERKRLLRELVPKDHPRLLYMTIWKVADRVSSSWCVNRTWKELFASRSRVSIRLLGSRSRTRTIPKLSIGASGSIGQAFI